MFFINYIISILSVYLQIGFLRYWFFPLLALAFLATVPVIVRKIFL